MFVFPLKKDTHSLSSADKRYDFSKTIENMLKGKIWFRQIFLLMFKE
jgi:hypothetical protein